MTEKTTVYSTVCARNYLPQVLALHKSILRHDPGVDLHVLLIDGAHDPIGKLEGLAVHSLDEIGLGADEIDRLRAIYDIVELSTAVKPLFFLNLLDAFDRVVYLDPDTFLTATLSPLEPLMDQHGVVLTPHFLRPVPHGTRHISDVHSLTVGIHNLGFGAFSRDARPFLEWWWSKLERDCLIYPLLGIFVDQKWTDVGANLFGACSLRDPGYNVGPWNLHERSIVKREDGYVIGNFDGELLRLFHFSGFDPTRPEEISVRLNADLKDADLASEALAQLSSEYAREVLEARRTLGALPRFPFDTDATGRAISTRMRRVYRSQLVSGAQPPSLFDADASQVRRWRRSSIPARLGSFMADAALAAKYASPDTFRQARKVLAGSFNGVRATLMQRNEIRR